MTWVTYHDIKHLQAMDSYLEAMGIAGAKHLPTRHPSNTGDTPAPGVDRSTPAIQGDDAINHILAGAVCAPAIGAVHMHHAPTTNSPPKLAKKRQAQSKALTKFSFDPSSALANSSCSYCHSTLPSLCVHHPSMSNMLSTDALTALMQVDHQFAEGIAMHTMDRIVHSIGLAYAAMAHNNQARPVWQNRAHTLTKSGPRVYDHRPTPHPRAFASERNMCEHS